MRRGHSSSKSVEDLLPPPLSKTALIRTRETCPCGAVFESDKDITWGSVEQAIIGFRKAHSICRGEKE